MAQIELEVVRAESPGEMIRSLVLKPAEGASLPAFTPGAHVEIQLPDGGSRPYSLIDFDGSCAAPEAYRLGVRLEPEGQGGSAYMHSLAEGARVTVTPPKNDFPLAEGAAPAVLIAGGIGITPVTAMASALQRAGTPYRLHYAARSRAAAAFADQLAGQHGAQFALHLDEEAGGPLDIAAIVAAADAAAHLYVCGPKPMIDAARAQAEAAGFGPGQIHFELFAAPEAAEGDSAFEVELASTGEVYTVPPGKSIIEVLEEAGEDIVYDCQRGDCGICQVDVLEGIPDHRDVVLSQSERDSGKVMQICVSRAKSARLKLDL